MRRVFLIVGGALLGTVFFISPTLAQRSEPLKANKFQATFVTGYQACTAPNDTSVTSLPFAACHPAVPDDDTCTIASDGGGKVKAKPDVAGDVAYGAQLKGIGGCEGETLVAVVSVRSTTNKCTSNDPNGCTLQDLTDFPISGTGSCAISGGKCKIKSTVNTEVPGTVVAGKLSSFAINGAGLKRSTGSGTLGKVAVAGILVP